MLKTIYAHIKEKLTYIVNNKKAYSLESTTMIGLGMIFLSFYEYYKNGLTYDQSNGLLIVGVGLLYPQGGDKSKITTNILTAILTALATYHGVKDIKDHKDTITDITENLGDKKK